MFSIDQFLERIFACNLIMQGNNKLRQYLAIIKFGKGDHFNIIS